MQFGTRCALCVIFFLISSCAWWSQETGFYGIQPAFEDYVPARMAILPCQLWPEHSYLKNQVVTNVPKGTTDKLCEEFELFVLKSFKNQPYMNGFPPNRVNELLKQNKIPDHLTKIPKLWESNPLESPPYAFATSYYLNVLQDKPEWRQWLLSLSAGVKQSDAVLLPLIQYATENQFDDRGLYVAQRTAHLLLFLIDTNSGRLLWAGHRQGTKSSTEFVSQGKQPSDLKYPSWEVISSQLFVEDFWKEFPGRLIY